MLKMVLIKEKRKWSIVCTLLCFRESPGSVGEVAGKWFRYLSDGRWKVCKNKFWTTGYDFAEMSKIDPDLYSQLSKASLIIFKVRNL